MKTSPTALKPRMLENPTCNATYALVCSRHGYSHEGSSFRPTSATTQALLGPNPEVAKRVSSAFAKVLLSCQIPQLSVFLHAHVQGQLAC